MNQKTLFLGNGLNRTLNGGISWAELMRKLGSQEPEGSNVPFPIEFEQLAARRGCLVGKRHVDPYKDLRDMIVKELCNEPDTSDSVRRCFRDLPFDHMVTTNYDRIFDNQYKLEAIVSNPGSSRNILGPIYKSGNRDFYHAHGIDKWKNTLCLGHEHYAALIGKSGHSTAHESPVARPIRRGTRSGRGRGADEPRRVSTRQWLPALGGIKCFLRRHSPMTTECRFL